MELRSVDEVVLETSLRGKAEVEEVGDRKNATVLPLPAAAQQPRERA